MSRVREGLFVLALLTFSSGCGGEAGVPARTASDVEPAVEAEATDPGPSHYESEIGGLSQEGIERELETAAPELRRCVDRAAANMSYLGGRVSLRMRLDRSGNVRWAYLSETTLGDRDTERCVLEVVKRRTWPRPLSGEGLAETSFDVDAADPPPLLPKWRTSLLTFRASSITKKCRKGVRGAFVATAYFGRRGDLLSIGVAPPDEKGEDAADCIVEALRDLRVDTRGSPPPATSKVSFRIP